MAGTEAGSEDRTWKQARRAALIEDVLAAFTWRSTLLMSFEHVQETLQLSAVRYRDLQVVPIDQIAGSVGRYDDFTRTFLPRGDHLQERWQRVERLVAGGRELPPVELYKVGSAYFVRDGNHRVSVARRHGQKAIKAYVWEYDTSVPLTPGADPAELLCRVAHAAFLEQTHLNELRPDLPLRLTEPDGYEELLHEIEHMQRVLSWVDRREISFHEAVGLWADIRYGPVVEIIRQQGVLHDFPRRTETDLYLWLSRHRQELQASREHTVRIDEAAGDLAKRYGPLCAGKLAVRAARAATRRAAGWWRLARRTRRNGR